MKIRSFLLVQKHLLLRQSPPHQLPFPQSLQALPLTLQLLTPHKNFHCFSLQTKLELSLHTTDSPYHAHPQRNLPNGHTLESLKLSHTMGSPDHAFHPHIPPDVHIQHPESNPPLLYTKDNPYRVSHPRNLPTGHTPYPLLPLLFWFLMKNHSYQTMFLNHLPVSHQFYLHFQYLSFPDL